jgi:hypothetical protein
MNELVVAHTIQFGGGADAHDPKRALLTLFLLASGVRELQAAFHRFLGGAIQF